MAIAPLLIFKIGNDSSKPNHFHFQKLEAGKPEVGWGGWGGTGSCKGSNSGPAAHGGYQFDFSLSRKKLIELNLMQSAVEIVWRATCGEELVPVPVPVIGHVVSCMADRLKHTQTLTASFQLNSNQIPLEFNSRKCHQRKEGSRKAN